MKIYYGKTKKISGKRNQIQRPGLGLASDTKRGVAVVVFIVLGLLFFLADINLAGSLGIHLLNILKWLFGVLAFIFPFILFLFAGLLAKQKLSKKDSGDNKEYGSFYLRIYLGAVLLMGSIAGLVHIFYISGTDTTAISLASEGKGGGYLGAFFGGPLYTYFRDFGQAV